MNRKTTGFRSLLLSAAALSMVATPALANHNWGWGGRHHRDRIDAGDVLTGICAGTCSTISRPSAGRPVRRATMACTCC